MTYRVVHESDLPEKLRQEVPANCWVLLEGDRIVGHDGGEPEDKILVRDLSWVLEELRRYE